MIALYTDSFPEEGHRALDIRKIPKKRVNYLLPSEHKDFSNETRFYDCWSKLTPFSLEEYDRVVQLDSDMLVMRNMDELMDVELDPPGNDGSGPRVFAASHACLCNPKKISHYPKNWWVFAFEDGAAILILYIAPRVPSNCAYTTQHVDPNGAQKHGASASTGLGILNGGLQIVNPSKAVYDLILERMTTSSVASYEFADQSLLSDLFFGRWVSLPYTYNALKTLRDVHTPIWRDDEVKNVHYILSPKPWDEKPGEEAHETHKWWVAANNKRREEEISEDLHDGF